MQKVKSVLAMEEVVAAYCFSGPREVDLLKQKLHSQMVLYIGFDLLAGLLADIVGAAASCYSFSSYCHLSGKSAIRMKILERSKNG